ncbi:MAG: hypothetical protein FJY98_01020 [Candidatus Liptonbacteria bacterium]|nr:hypothetical protein [Candidatus Liptonbacteria bacterium]
MDKLLIRVFLVPNPIPPAVAFAFFLFRKLGMLSNEVIIKYHHHREGGYGESAALIHFFGNEAVCRIALLKKSKDNRLVDKLQELIRERAPHEEQTLLLKMLNYFSGNSMDAEHHKRLGNLMVGFLRLTLHHHTPRQILEKAVLYFNQYLVRKISPWKEWIGPDHVPDPDISEINGQRRPMGERRVFIPISMREGNQEVTALTLQDLKAGRICDLKGKRLFGVIGGNPGVGKSTLATSLMLHMQCILHTLSTYRGWENTTLQVKRVTMDLATPTSDAIEKGRGKIRAETSALKRPWTQEMAWAALEHVHQTVRSGADIVLADLPGKITPEITEVVAAPADFCILLGKNPDEFPPWREFMHKLGVIILAEMITNERPGIITGYERNKFLTGTIQDPDRTIRPDGVVSLLAELLLLEFLPSFVETRIIKLLLENWLRSTPSFQKK